MSKVGQCIRAWGDHLDCVNDVAFVDEAEHILVTCSWDRSLRIFDSRVTCCGEFVTFSQSRAQVLSCLCSRLLIPQSNRCVGVLDGHSDVVSPVATIVRHRQPSISGYSHTLSASHDGTVRLWNLKKMDTEEVFQPVSACSSVQMADRHEVRDCQPYFLFGADGL